MNFLVSVIIPTYNAEKTISRALNSVIDQTYAPIEIIIVDDASEDQTLSVVNRTLSDYDRFDLIERDTRGGPGGARNLGLQSAEGNFLAFLDADDAWKPEKIELQLKAMNSDNSSISTTDLEVYEADSDSKWIKNLNFHESSEKNIRDIYNNDIDNLTPTIVFRREVLQELREFPLLEHKEDHLFVMRALNKFNHVHLSTSLTERYVTESGFSTGSNRDYQKELESYEKFNQYAINEFPFLKEEEEQFLSWVYFKYSEHLDLEKRKWNKIDPQYLSFPARVKYRLRRLGLGSLIPFLSKLRKIFALGQ